LRQFALVVAVVLYDVVMVLELSEGLWESNLHELSELVVGPEPTRLQPLEPLENSNEGYTSVSIEFSALPEQDLTIFWDRGLHQSTAWIKRQDAVASLGKFDLTLDNLINFKLLEFN
jgi:hypothetical protein